MRSAACVLALIAAVAVASVAASDADALSLSAKPDPWKGLRHKTAGKKAAGGKACGTGMSECIAIPADKNSGLTFPTPAAQGRMFGPPGCDFTPDCKPIGNAKVKSNLAEVQIKPGFSVKAQKPFAEALKRAFDAMKASGKADVIAAYNEVKSNGAACCRCIAGKAVGGKKTCKRAGAWSNHSWGLAVDVYYGAAADPRGDGKCQKGLAVMAPYLHAEKLFWGAGYKGKSEDSMHFEASNEVIAQWKAAGQLKL